MNIKSAVDDIYKTTFSVEPTCDFETAIERCWRGFCRKYWIDNLDSKHAYLLKYAVSHVIMFSILQDAITKYVQGDKNRELLHIFIKMHFEKSKEEIEKMIDENNSSIKEDSLINLIDEIMLKTKKIKELIGVN